MNTMPSAHTAAPPGRPNPVSLVESTRSEGRGRTHTAADMTSVAVGHASALTNAPGRDAANDVEKRLIESPATTIVRPAASGIHTALRDPGSKALPPTTSPSNTKSPMG